MEEPQCPQCREYLKIIEEQGQIIAALRSQIDEMRALFESEIAALKKEIAELRDQLSKNSRNSSKPPSTDGYRKPEPKSLREKSGRNPGGQKGHEGETLKMVAKSDEVIVHGVSHCGQCGCALDDVTAEVEKRQVFDLPPVKLKVTEHVAETKRCPSCGRVNRTAFPAFVTAPVQYGQGIRSIAVYLLQYQMLPYDRTSELMADLFSASMSAGTLANAVSACSASVEPATKKIKGIIQGSPVVHFDESGGSVNGKLKWFHSASTSLATHYGLHAKRGSEAMDDIGILPGFEGRAIHDFWKPYLGYDCEHGLCNAHLLRELIFLHEEQGQRWAKKMISHLLKIKEAVDATRLMADHLPRDHILKFERRCRRILAMGRVENPVPLDEPVKKKRGRPKKSKAANLIDRFEKYPKEIFAFMYDFRVPFDNNLSERDIRMIKVKMKISGTFRSEEGGEAFCRIRSYISTARKNAVGAIDAIKAAFAGQPFIPVASQGT